MGIGNASPRKKVDEIKKAKDFYQTPTPAVKCLREHLEKLEIIEFYDLLDPCCGLGQIGREFKDVGIVQTDISNGYDFLKLNNEDYDSTIILMNPPYSQKNEFIRHAMKNAEHVFAILPLQVMNYISFTDEFLNIPEFKGKAIVYPKIFMSDEPIYKQGGLTAYAWFHWSKHYRCKDMDKYEYYYDMRRYLNGKS